LVGSGKPEKKEAPKAAARRWGPAARERRVPRAPVSRTERAGARGLSALPPLTSCRRSSVVCACFRTRPSLPFSLFFLDSDGPEDVQDGSPRLYALVYGVVVPEW